MNKKDRERVEKILYVVPIFTGYTGMLTAIVLIGWGVFNSAITGLIVGVVTKGIIEFKKEAWLK